MKNLRKKFIIITQFIVCIFVQPLFSSSNTNAFHKHINIYVMLDVDGTITQRIDPNDTETITRVQKAGFDCYRLKFFASKYDHLKYYRWYASMLEDETLRNEQKVNVHILNDTTLEIEEVVVLRPIIPAFLEKLDSLNNPCVSVKFYIASRNDDIRNQNLIDHLNVTINGTPFHKKVKLIPREDFRVHVFSPQEGLIAGKSSALVRAKFKTEQCQEIGPDAYIVFVDNIAPERFVIGNKDLDHLLRPTRFIIANLNEIDIRKDRSDFESIFNTIKALLNTPINIINK